MKTSVSASDFIHGMKAIRPENFSYNGLTALFEYLEDLEDSIGEELEFDPIAICCDFTEYESALEAAKEYGFEEPNDPDYDPDELEEDAIEYLNNEVSTISFDDGVIVHG